MRKHKTTTAAERNRMKELYELIRLVISNISQWLTHDIVLKKKRYYLESCLLLDLL